MPSRWPVEAHVVLAVVVPFALSALLTLALGLTKYDVSQLSLVLILTYMAARALWP